MEESDSQQQYFMSASALKQSLCAKVNRRQKIALNNLTLLLRERHVEGASEACNYVEDLPARNQQTVCAS